MWGRDRRINSSKFIENYKKRGSGFSVAIVGFNVQFVHIRGRVWLIPRT